MGIERENFNVPELAMKELALFGLEASPENIRAVEEQRQAKQIPEGYEEITASLDDPEKLKELMASQGIKSIIHSEGPAVWDHVRLSLQEIQSLDISEAEKEDLRLIMLYHDLGKTTAGASEKNITQTKKKLAKGELHQAMIGHHQERLADIETGFRANGIDGRKLKMFMSIVENHMNTSLLDQDPKKTVKLFSGFGENGEEIEQTVKLLILVLQADGNATQHIELENGELNYSKNEKKLKLDFASVWKKYEEGKILLRQEEEKRKKQEADEVLEISIFGKKLSQYLVGDRGIKPGPEMGKAIGRAKTIIAESQNKTPAEIKIIINGTEL